MEQRNDSPWQDAQGARSQGNSDQQHHSQQQSPRHGGFNNGPQVHGPTLPLPGGPPPPSQYNQAGNHYQNASSSVQQLPGVHSLGSQSQYHSINNRLPPPASPSGSHRPSTSQQLGPPQGGQGYSLPAINKIAQGDPERERAYQEMDLEEQRQRQQHDYEYQQRLIQHQQREQQEQQHAQQQQAQQRQMQQHHRASPEMRATSVPLQQPIATHANGLHGPNGILGSGRHHIPPPGYSYGPGAPPNNFPGEAALPPNMARQGLPPPNDLSNQSRQSNFNSMPPMRNENYLPPVATININGSQQPILNDALTYLDQVKLMFQMQPDVYNKFLDIMKDFKSQSIDTPGVIQRVSDLFQGHPQLIEGFNTFLPPGYKIEAGYNDNPNSIRVTTPSGTTAMETNAQGSLTNKAPRGLGDFAQSPPREAGPHNEIARDQYQMQARNDAMYGGDQQQGPMMRPQDSEQYAQNIREGELAAQEAALAHQQQLQQQQIHQHPAQEQAASQLQNVANNSASENLVQREMQSSPPVGNGNRMVKQPSPSEGERRPIEFNHAISYVNKIKNRYQHQPEVYKQFLEILQTYQRESKPIQDVYTQVTELFNNATDLLEDFKQFLPEAAPQHKAAHRARAAAQAQAEVPISSVRGEPLDQSRAHTPRAGGQNMPPLGNFMPPSVTKDNNKKRRGAGTTQTTAPTAVDSSRTAAVNAQANKRQRVVPAKQSEAESMIQSPTLAPTLPRPLPPGDSSFTTTTDDIAFFDRVKKYLANKVTYNEFLKLIQMWVSDILDKDTLISRAEAFIGANPDLMAYFKRQMRLAGMDDKIDNRPARDDYKVSLSSCRGLGPSYRLLPKRERFAKCSGRDALCHSVLNDEWVSHPTWASEDSGFIAHRKNTYEEALHRMEEERHEYDFNIETCLRSIQLLEPIAQTISYMNPEEVRTYRISRPLGGPSEAIWHRVIKKIYEPEAGRQLIEAAYEAPGKVIPFLLTRIRERVEKWKQYQREWEKIWRDQTQRQFWRSLDHLGISAKGENKRQFTPKALQLQLNSKYEENLKLRQLYPGKKVSPYHLEYTFKDLDVVADAMRFLYLVVNRTYAQLPSEAIRINNQLSKLISVFFGVDNEELAAKTVEFAADVPIADDVESDSSLAVPSFAPRRGRQPARKGLLRGVLDKKAAKKDLEDNGGSKESTPDPMALDEDTSAREETQSEKSAERPQTPRKWTEQIPIVEFKGKAADSYNKPFKRDSFSLYANMTIYYFMRQFQTLCARLSTLKEYEDRVKDDVARGLQPKAAIELGINEKLPNEYFEDVSDSANYYQQILKMMEEVIAAGELATAVEDTLRRFYMPYCWSLYSFDKMAAATIKFATVIVGNDNKERNQDVLNLFYRNRAEIETTHQTELEYRRQVERISKDNEICRIVWHQPTSRMTYQLLRKDDPTFDPEGVTAQRAYDYYLSAFFSYPRTEGVPRPDNLPLLERNISRTKMSRAELDNTYLTPAKASEHLEFHISRSTYALNYKPRGLDWQLGKERKRSSDSSDDVNVEKLREEAFATKLVTESPWTKTASKEEIEEAEALFRQLARTQKIEPAPEQEQTGTTDENVKMDESMAA